MRVNAAFVLLWPKRNWHSSNCVAGPRERLESAVEGKREGKREVHAGCYQFADVSLCQPCVDGFWSPGGVWNMPGGLCGSAYARALDRAGIPDEAADRPPYLATFVLLKTSPWQKCLCCAVPRCPDRFQPNLAAHPAVGLAAGSVAGASFAIPEESPQGFSRRSVLLQARAAAWGVFPAPAGIVSGP